MLRIQQGRHPDMLVLWCGSNMRGQLRKPWITRHWVIARRIGGQNFWFNARTSMSIIQLGKKGCSCGSSKTKSRRTWILPRREQPAHLVGEVCCHSTWIIIHGTSMTRDLHDGPLAWPYNGCWHDVGMRQDSPARAFAVKAWTVTPWHVPRYQVMIRPSHWRG